MSCCRTSSEWDNQMRKDEQQSEKKDRRGVKNDSTERTDGCVLLLYSSRWIDLSRVSRTAEGLFSHHSECSDTVVCMQMIRDFNLLLLPHICMCCIFSSDPFLESEESCDPSSLEFFDRIPHLYNFAFSLQVFISRCMKTGERREQEHDFRRR